MKTRFRPCQTDFKINDDSPVIPLCSDKVPVDADLDLATALCYLPRGIDLASKSFDITSSGTDNPPAEDAGHAILCGNGLSCFHANPPPPSPLSPWLLIV